MWCSFYPREGTKSSHVRVSFSEIGKEDAELGISRLAATIRQKRDELRAAKA
jgi:DNA-binding transcriptional MocR family regulator